MYGKIHPTKVILLLIFCNEKLIYLKNKKNDLANSAFINYRNKNTEYVII